LFHVQAQRFHCEKDAHSYLNQIAKKWKYHEVGTIEIKHKKCFEQKGRPTLETQPIFIEYQIIPTDKKQDNEFRTDQINKEACFIIGTNVLDATIQNQAIIPKYKEQQNFERGFRFLKDPLFFVSSLFLKKTSTYRSPTLYHELCPFSIFSCRKNFEDEFS
jgi:transposase